MFVQLQSNSGKNRVILFSCVRCLPGRVLFYITLSINQQISECCVLPNTISVPRGFNKLKPFWVSEPPSGSRTMSTPVERWHQIGFKKDHCINLVKHENTLLYLQYVLYAYFLTLWADFADFLHVVFGAVVDGVSYPALGNGLMFGGWCCAKNSHILHSLTQLGSSNTHTTYRCADSSTNRNENGSNCRFFPLSTAFQHLWDPSLKYSLMKQSNFEIK